MICRMALLIPQIKNRALLTAAAASLVQRTADQMKRFRKRKGPSQKTVLFLIVRTK